MGTLAGGKIFLTSYIFHTEIVMENMYLPQGSQSLVDLLHPGYNPLEIGCLDFLTGGVDSVCSKHL